MAIILRTLRKRPTAPLGQRGAPAGPLGVGGHVLPLSFRFGTVFCAIESQTQGDSAQPRQAASTTRCLVTALKPHAGAHRAHAKFWSWGGSARGREVFPFWDTLLRPQRGAVKSLRWSPRDAWCPRVHRESGQRALPRSPGLWAATQAGPSWEQGDTSPRRPARPAHSAPGVCEGDAEQALGGAGPRAPCSRRAGTELGKASEKASGLGSGSFSFGLGEKKNSDFKFFHNVASAKQESSYARA